MSQDILTSKRTRDSLRGREAARSVLLRMAIEAERAERVRQLKQQRPDITWNRIAEAVGVKERSVIEWQKTGGMDYGNAKKFANFMGVSIDWLWSGVPDPVAADDSAGDDQPDQLDRIENKLDAILEHLGLSEPGQLLEQELANAGRTSTERATGTAPAARARRRASR